MRRIAKVLVHACEGVLFRNSRHSPESRGRHTHVFVIGNGGRNVSRVEALSHVFGYTEVNDHGA